MRPKKKRPLKTTNKKEIDKELGKLGSRIRELRIKKGYSSAEYFAYDHDISRAQYARYEKGEDLRYSILFKVVKAFDITFEDFFSEGFD